MKPIKTCEYFNSPQAAEYLGFALSTVNNSRYSGILAGIRAPLYIKIGKSIRYAKHSLDDWLSKFTPQNNTSETKK